MTLTGEGARWPGPSAVRHGTYSGYRLHYYYGSKPCEACRRAKRDYTRQAAARKRNGWLPGVLARRIPCTRGLGWPAEARRVPVAGELR